jgi:hypothetical protein
MQAHRRRNMSAATRRGSVTVIADAAAADERRWLPDLGSNQGPAD